MATIKYEIKSRATGEVIFSAKIPADTPSEMMSRVALEKAVASGANLYGANLSGADLRDADLTGADLRIADLTGADLRSANLYGANLYGAYLSGANLRSANLSGAYLYGAYLSGANLSGANLSGANLSGANLSGANLYGAYLSGGEKLIGDRPIFQIGPIGSRCAWLVAYITDKCIRIDAGCQRQITREAFMERLQETHGDNEHAEEYRAALAMIDAHAKIWTPK